MSSSRLRNNLMDWNPCHQCMCGAVDLCKSYMVLEKKNIYLPPSGGFCCEVCDKLEFMCSEKKLRGTYISQTLFLNTATFLTSFFPSPFPWSIIQQYLLYWSVHPSISWAFVRQNLSRNNIKVTQNNIQVFQGKEHIVTGWSRPTQEVPFLSFQASLPTKLVKPICLLEDLLLGKYLQWKVNRYSWH